MTSHSYSQWDSYASDSDDGMSPAPDSGVTSPATSPESNSTTPTFVLVPGAFHLSSCWQDLEQQLHSLGYRTSTSTLPSVANPAASLSGDAEHIRNTLLNPLIAAGESVILVAHSYGGYPASSAIQGLSIRDRRAQGYIGGIVGIVWLTAFIPMPDVALFDLLGRKWKEWHRPDQIAGTLEAADAEHIFYADVYPKERAILAAQRLKNHSIRALKEKPQKGSLGYADTGFDGRRAYITCRADNAVPLVAQDAMVKKSGVEWVMKEMTTGHSPFLADPKGLAVMLKELEEDLFMS